MPRKGRSAPNRESDPLDVYSAWDIRYARFIFYGFILATVIVVLGVWGVILQVLFQNYLWLL